MKLVTERTNTETRVSASHDRAHQTLQDVATALAIAAEALQLAEITRVENGTDFYEEVRRFEIKLIERALKHTGGNQARAARLLKLKQTTLHSKIKQYGICSQVLIYHHAEATPTEDVLAHINERKAV